MAGVISGIVGCGSSGGRGRADASGRRRGPVSPRLARAILPGLPAPGPEGGLGVLYEGFLGPPREAALAETGYRARTRFWEGPEREAAVTLGEQAGTCRLGWGFKTPTR